MLHGDELQTQGVSEPDLFLTGRTSAARDLQPGSLWRCGERLASAAKVWTLWRLQKNLPAAGPLVHHGALHGFTGAVHHVQIVAVLQPRVRRRQAPEQSGDAAVVPRQAVLWRQHVRGGARALLFSEARHSSCTAEPRWSWWGRPESQGMESSGGSVPPRDRCNYCVRGGHSFDLDQ